jgi:DNA-binding beta-propeller fold protein YncE
MQITSGRWLRGRLALGDAIEIFLLCCRRGTLAVLAAAGLSASAAQAEIRAMVNYESRHGAAAHKEGIAIIDVDPNSANFGKILTDVPLPHGMHNHHIFYNKDATKAYITGLGEHVLSVMDMTQTPYQVKNIAVSDCGVGEDLILSDDNTKWYLTCMGSSTVIFGDAVNDVQLKTIPTPKPYPHGIAIHEGIDRILITSTVKHDLTEPGETITAIEASTGKVLNSHKVSNKPSPSGEAPVEILFVPGTTPPVAYITNMFGASLWAAVWNAGKQDFEVRQITDLAPINGGVPLEMYFNSDADRFYLTTANPGQFHIFDIGDDPFSPKLIKSLPAAGGAHHVAFTKDGQYAFVQNNLLGLDGMNDGSITVIDLKAMTVVTSIETFKDMGLHPNLIVLLPDWNDPAGH